jgi:hypothetical protein
MLRREWNECDKYVIDARGYMPTSSAMSWAGQPVSLPVHQSGFHVTV